MSRPVFILILLAIALLTLQFLSLGFGPTPVSLSNLFADWTGTKKLSASEQIILWDLRWPRILLAGFVGAGLGAAGAGYQGLFRNPLADPFVIGASSGAALGVAVAVVLGVQVSSVIGVSINSLAALHQLLASGTSEAVLQEVLLDRGYGIPVEIVPHPIHRTPLIVPHPVPHSQRLES